MEAAATGAEAAEEAPAAGDGVEGNVGEGEGDDAPAAAGTLDAVLGLPGDDAAHGGGAVGDGGGGSGAQAVDGGDGEDGEEGEGESKGWCHWEGGGFFFFFIERGKKMLRV